MVTYTREITGDDVVSIAELQEYLRVFDPQQQTLLQSLLDTAQDYVETYIERGIRLQTVSAYFDKLESKMQLPYGNATALNGVTYTDGEENEQTLAASDYRLLVGNPNRVIIKPVPNQKHDYEQGAVITYVSGFALPTDCPEKYKTAIMVMVADLYENRERQIVGTIVAINSTTERVLNQLRVYGL